MPLLDAPAMSDPAPGCRGAQELPRSAGAAPERERCPRSLPLPTQRVGAEPAGFQEEAVVLCWGQGPVWGSSTRCGIASDRCSAAIPGRKIGDEQSSSSRRSKHSVRRLHRLPSWCLVFHLEEHRMETCQAWVSFPAEWLRALWGLCVC